LTGWQTTYSFAGSSAFLPSPSSLLTSSFDEQAQGGLANGSALHAAR
jgi:hypothetical protein